MALVISLFYIFNLLIAPFQQASEDSDVDDTFKSKLSLSHLLKRREVEVWTQKKLQAQYGDSQESPDFPDKANRLSGVIIPDNKPAENHETQGTSPFKLESNNSRPTESNDVFISVKSTKKYHAERLDLLLETWIMFARDQVGLLSNYRLLVILFCNKQT